MTKEVTRLTTTAGDLTELAARIDALAGAERRTRSQMIRVLLEEALEARR
jgi:predicted transcriptional regulator